MNDELKIEAKRHRFDVLFMKRFQLKNLNCRKKESYVALHEKISADFMYHLLKK